jgi:filamentous hemagglutinin family protein
MANSLNHIFRTIWSDALNTWIAVSEITSAKGKRSKSCALNTAALAENDGEAGNVAKPNRRLKLKPLAFDVACCFSLHAQANPSGAQIVNGSASISQNGTLLTVTNSPNAIINWQGFSIQSGETTNFIQQSTSSSVLNRVVGPDPSALLGNLTSNGKVFLINPAGILVGQGARIEVPGLVASTLNLSNADFLAGKLNFTNPSPAGGGGAGVRVSASAGTLINNGTITTPEGGSVYLIALQVENSGTTTTPKGETILAAGNTVQLIDTGTPGVSVQITGTNNTATNLGQILADSGRIGMVGAVVKNSGTLNANSLVSQGGRIFLKATSRIEAGGTLSAQGASGGSISILADMQNGTVNVSGTLDASALPSVDPLPSPDELTSHSTKAGESASQVAGYPPGGEGTQPQVSGINTASIRSPSVSVPSPTGGGLGRGNPLGLVGTIPAATATPPTGGQLKPQRPTFK